MLVLGVHDGHDAGVALLADGEILFASNEERFSRVKMHHGFPSLCLSHALTQAGVTPGEIDLIAFGGFGPIYSPHDLDFSGGSRVSPLRRAYGAAARSGLVRMDIGPVYHLHRMISRAQRGMPVRRRSMAELQRLGFNAPISHLDHHACHAACAYYTSPFDNATVLTVDGGGDGLAGSIYQGSGGRLHPVYMVPKIHSAGNFWAYITYLCGFNPTRHGGKVTGLAAHTPCPEALEKLRRYFGYRLNPPRWDNRRSLFWQDAVETLRRELEGFGRDQVAWAAQRLLEENLAPVAAQAIRRCGSGNLALAGGVFANVRLNQVIMNLPAVDDLFVHPHMGDGGLALGAALLAEARASGGLAPRLMRHAFLGAELARGYIENIARRNGLTPVQRRRPQRFIAQCLSEKKIVGLVRGRAEYGPRALCHRSILAEPGDPTMMDWLNDRLERSEFMPFAPVIRDDAASRYFLEYPKGADAARFMTVCYDCTDLCRKQAPGVVHVDGTARPQVVHREEDAYMHQVLKEYEAFTGRPLCVNTSFNRHEEPIVNRMEDAVVELLAGRVDALVVEDFEIRKPE